MLSGMWDQNIRTGIMVSIFAVHAWGVAMFKHFNMKGLQGSFYPPTNLSNLEMFD